MKFFNRLANLRPVSAIIESIRNKLLFWFLVLSVIPLVALGATAYYISSTSLNTAASNQLDALRTSKANTIQNYFDEREGDMGVLVETVNTLREEAFDKLEAVQKLKRDEINNYFAERLGDVSVLASNPTVVEALKAFDEVPGTIGGTDWQAIEQTYGPWLVQYKEEYGYYDLFLISTNGEILYTVEKESDFGQNLKTGSLKDIQVSGKIEMTK